MYIGSAVVRVSYGATDRVSAQLEQLEGVSVLGRSAQELAVLIEADTPKQQQALHRQVANLSEVEAVALIFQSGEVD